LRVAARGFSQVEFWGWRDKNIPAIQAACRQNGVRVANFSGHRKGSPIAKPTHQTFFAEVADALPIARALDCHALMLLTNALNSDGSVAERFEEIPDDLKFKNVVSSLAELTRVTPDDITLLLEPLNTLVDHPGYYLDNIDVSAKIVRQGVMGADLEDLISRHFSLIGHFHIADFPGRHEPGTGSADWPALLQQIKALGYRGNVGFEFFPQQDAEAALSAIHDLGETNMQPL